MNFFRSVVGGAIGFMVGGPIGAILGVSIAHQFGNDAISNTSTDPSSQAQMAFFVATFSVMGHVAKVNDRVLPEAIAFAEHLMTEMKLDSELRATAINLFHQGKKIDFQLNPVLAQFYQECWKQDDLIQQFLNYQLQIAAADGSLSNKADELLWRICNRLRLSRFYYERTKIQFLTQQYFYQQKQRIPKSRQTSSLAEAYRELGLTPNASQIEVKKAYRRLMSQHHPDKLVAKGLSEDIMQLAKEKTQQISKAYETIQKFGGNNSQ
jgi:DnaJ like chaperone protein